MEDVAQHCVFCVWVERDRSGLIVVGIGEGKEEFASGESVEAVVSVSLDLVVDEVLGVFSEGVDGPEELVDFRVSVHVGPKGFSVSRVHTTTIGLLITIVDDGNTDGGHSECKRGLE